MYLSKTFKMHHLHPYKMSHLHNAECVKCLGKGSFGNVKLFKCKDRCKDKELCNKYFVVKYITSKCNTKKQLLNEYTIGTLLHHPNIIETLDVDLEDNSIIFQYSPGTDFLHYITDKPILKDSLLYFSQIIDGVSYMHSIGIAHMDLKLENIMVDNVNKKIQIIDLGQSKVFHDTLHINTIIPGKGLHGTRPYIAPEEFMTGEEYNPEKVDVWSCGIILYEIIYNVFPWKEATLKDSRYTLFLKYHKVDQLEGFLQNTIARDIIKAMLTPNPVNRFNIKQVRKEFVFDNFNSTI